MKLTFDFTGGYKIRIHRIIFQLIVFTIIVKMFGWWALFFTLIAFAIEFVPYLKIDEAINPFYKKWLEEKRERELIEHYSDLDEFCPNCRQKYDERDREYQICHLCGHFNNPEY